MELNATKRLEGNAVKLESATWDRSRPRGVALNKIKLGDTFKGEPNAVALDKGICVFTSSGGLSITKINVNSEVPSHVTLTLRELKAVLAAM